MYSEMVFTYNNVLYEVFLRGEDAIIFCSTNMVQEYATKEEFFEKANINGKLLKDIWGKVENADYNQ